MPFGRPNLAELRSQTRADLAAAVPGADPLLPVSNLGIMADVQAEGFNGAYGYLDYIARQATPFTAVDEAFEGWAGLKGMTRKPATRALGSVTLTGSVGAVLAAGAQLVRGDGVAYVTQAEATVGGGGTLTVALEAVTAGLAGTLETGSTLVLSQAVAGVSATGSAIAGAPGVDVEAFDDFRTRVLAAFASPPQGGAGADYVEWALSVPGVTRAWCVRNIEGPGTVGVYVMLDTVRADDDGFPDGTNGVAVEEHRDATATGDQLLVADAIWPLQPVTALVYVYAPFRNQVDMTISRPGASAELKARIEAAIVSVLRTEGRPGGVVNNSDIEAAISAIPDASGFVITAVSCSDGAVSPTNGNITSDPGHLPVLDTVTWA